MALPWPDQLALKLVAYMPGKVMIYSTSYDQSYIQTRNNFSASFQDAFHKNLRRTVMRYVNLSNILVMRQISVKVERQFPDNQALLDAKLLRAPEALRLEKIDAKTPHESRCF